MSGGSDTGLLAETVERLLSERCGPDVCQEAEATGWAPELWDALATAGLTTVGVPESAGGSGGDLSDVCTLVAAAGRYAVPLPLAETAMLGGWLADRAGLTLPAGPLSVAVPRADDWLRLDGSTLAGRLTRVPWATRVTAVVAVVADGGGREHVVLIDPALARVTPGRNLAGEPRDTLEVADLRLGADQVAPVAEGTAAELVVRGALARALAMAGAMEAVTQLTLGYAGERRQFGRPIAAFQAVGQRLVRLAEEAEAAGLAAEVAAQRYAQVGMGASREIAIAKVTAGRSAAEVAAHAHQVHGAMGMTQEYRLHLSTRRLWVWRHVWGSPRHWASVLGGELVAGGAAGLWEAVASGLVAR
jgi:acyl-CoA dehydrogenase